MAKKQNDEVVMALKNDDEVVSIDTLKPEEIDKIMKAVSSGKSVADNYYRDTVEPRLVEREKIYMADQKHYDAKFPILSESSKWVSRDVKTAIDWMVPSLMEPFTGTDDPVAISARNLDDVDKSKKIEQLLKYELQTKNDYSAFVNDVLVDHLKLNFGVAKGWWKHEEQRSHWQIMISPDDYADMAYIAQQVQTGTMDITDISKVKGGYYNIEFDQIDVTANYPVVEHLPPSEFRFTPEQGDIQLCKFVAHRKIVTGDYLARQEQAGVYQNTDEAITKTGDTEPTEFDLMHNKDLNNSRYGLTDNDNASKLVELYECYVNVDYNNDGIYEKLIVHTVGDSGIPIKIQTNDFGMVPFFVISAERDPAVIFPERCGYADIIEQQQDLKTALIRQVIINVAKANAPRMAFDAHATDVDALLNGDENIPTNGDPTRVFYQFNTPSLSSITMDMVNYAQNEIEAQTGSTRYNQGLDSDSLNRTATGIQAVLGMAEKKQTNLARIDAELFFKPIFRFLIQLNQKYADEETLIRVGDQNVSISKDDLNVDYDLVLNIGQGAGTKEARIQYLMVLLQQIYPSLVSMGLVNAGTYYVTSKGLLEEMGLLNAEKSLVDPTTPQYAQWQQSQAQQALAQAQASAQQYVQEKQAIIAAKAQADVMKAKVPRVSVGMNDLPPDSQVQVLANMGIPTTATGMVAKMAKEAANGQRS